MAGGRPSPSASWREGFSLQGCLAFKDAKVTGPLLAHTNTPGQLGDGAGCTQAQVKHLYPSRPTRPASQSDEPVREGQTQENRLLQATWPGQELGERQECRPGPCWPGQQFWGDSQDSVHSEQSLLILHQGLAVPQGLAAPTQGTRGAHPLSPGCLAEPRKHAECL